MAYIGNTAASRFVSNRAASVYSGDGSTVAFTLEQVVTQDEDVLVSVDGVVQEPSVAYAVSSGTTLTFTAAPSNNAGNNIFVYYLASQAGTIGHPSTQGLTATTGVFSSNATVAGTLGVTGNATLAGTIAVTGTSTLTGVTALGNTDSTVKSEGGAVTTIIAQGLAKAWCNLNGTGTVAIRDSLNITDVTDNGSVGYYTFNIANDMNDANYAAAFGDSASDANNDGGWLGIKNGTTNATGSFIVITDGRSTGEFDPLYTMTCVHGDLA
jgi:hypothetical protein